MGAKFVKFPDILKYEGVMAKGFGIICKFPMRDRDLNLAAKGIYALLCCYARDDSSAYPSRATIMETLGIGKEKYYSGLNQLIDQGYISVESSVGERGRFSHNIYTIISNPKKFKDAQDDTDGGQLTIGYSGLMAAGYGAMPRMVMFDKRLDCTEKVIYAYLASFSGKGTAPFPRVQSIMTELGISKAPYTRHMKHLVELNYISRVQRHVNGKLSTYNYCLNANPDEAAADSGAAHPVIIIKDEKLKQKKSTSVQGYQNQDTVQQDTVEQATVEQDTVEQDAVEQDAVGQDTVYQATVQQDTVPQDTVVRDTNNNNKNNNNSFNNITLSINREFSWMEGLSREEIKESIREEWELELYTPEVKKGSGLRISDEELEYFVDIAADFIYSRKPVLSVRGVAFPREEVISRILALSPDECQFILNQIANVSSPIKNPRRYILSCMVTAREDAEMQAAIEAAQDMKHDTRLSPEYKEWVRQKAFSP